MKILEKLKRIPRRLTCLIVGHDFIVETEETDDSWWEKEIDKIFEAYKDNPKLLRQYLALFFNSVNLSPTLAWRRSKTIWRCKRCGYEEVYYSYDKNSFDVIAYINKKLIEYGYPVCQVKTTLAPHTFQCPRIGKIIHLENEFKSLTSNTAESIFLCFPIV